MEIGWSALWFIVAVSLLVTVHEFGHFWVARKLGFKVLRFSVGFGKPLYKRVGPAPDHTEFVIAAMPLGGYVRMLDERDGEVAPEDLPRAFASKPPWQRILVHAGRTRGEHPVRHRRSVGHLLDQRASRFTSPWWATWLLGSPAAAAGLRSGDQFVSIDGEPIRDQGDVALGLLDMRQRRWQRRHRPCAAAMGSSVTCASAFRMRTQRHKLTEPTRRCFAVLGSISGGHRSPARLGEVLEGGPGGARRPRSPAISSSLRTARRSAAYNDLAEYINARPGETVTLVSAAREQRSDAFA